MALTCRSGFSPLIYNSLQKVQSACKTGKGCEQTEHIEGSFLCAQFLKDYVNGDLFKGLRTEDIEEVSEKYQAYLGSTFEMDTDMRGEYSQMDILDGVEIYLDEETGELIFLGEDVYKPLGFESYYTESYFTYDGGEKLEETWETC